MSQTLVAATITGTFAILGVLGGSILTEHQRASRERDARLHAVRQDLYSQYLTHVRVMAEWARQLAETPELAPEEITAREGRPNRAEWLRAAAQYGSEIDLVGTLDVISSVLKLRMAAYFWAINREQLHRLEH